MENETHTTDRETWRRTARGHKRAELEREWQEASLVKPAARPEVEPPFEIDDSIFLSSPLDSD